MTDKIPFSFYLYIHKKLIEHANRLDEIPLSEVRMNINEWYNIPLTVATSIIKEMQKLQLIKIKGKYNHAKVIIINHHRSKLVDNTSKLYKMVGCW